MIHNYCYVKLLSAVGVLICFFHFLMLEYVQNCVVFLPGCFIFMERIDAVLQMRTLTMNFLRKVSINFNRIKEINIILYGFELTFVIKIILLGQFIIDYLDFAYNFFAWMLIRTLRI